MVRISSIILATILSLSAVPCEILVKARDYTHPDPEKDRRGAYKRGMPVVVKEDGHPWGAEESLPRFVIIKIPMVPASRLAKYVAEHLDNGEVFRRREWIIRWADLPAAARTKLSTTGQLVIKSTPEYTGSFDYTWTQVKQYFRNQRTNTDETGDL